MCKINVFLILYIHNMTMLRYLSLLAVISSFSMKLNTLTLAPVETSLEHFTNGLEEFVVHFKEQSAILDQEINGSKNTGTSVQIATGTLDKNRILHALNKIQLLVDGMCYNCQAILSGSNRMVKVTHGIIKMDASLAKFFNPTQMACIIVVLLCVMYFNLHLAAHLGALPFVQVK